MKRLIVISFASFFTLFLSAQSWESVKNNTTEYLYGEGWGNSIDEADKQALAALISKIAVNISSTSENKDNSTITNGQLDEVSQFSSSVHTYSQATLTNTERVIIQNEPDAHVGRWIRRAEIEKIFASRIAKVQTMVEAAIKAEAKGKADDALRNYYWALTLLKSLQRPNEVSYTDEDGQAHMLTVWIPEKMNDVFQSLSASVVKRNGDDVELYITYKDKPVNSVDYTYFDGRGWSNIYSAKDGRGVLELAPGNTSATYQLKFEFEYRGQAQIDRELESVLNVVKSTPMRGAYANLQAVEDSQAAATSVQSQTTSTSMQCQSTSSFSTTAAEIKKAPTQVADSAAYSKVVDSVLNSIRTLNYDAVKQHFTQEGWDIYQKIVRYGKAKIVGTPSMQFYKNGDYVIGRGVQMSFSFQRGLRKSFVEDIVFSFNQEGLIYNLAFGLGNTAADDILNKGVWSEQARLSIMNFLENYKTAYGLKRLDYIRSIFDDDAVIIVGNIVRQAKMTINPETGVATTSNNTIIKKNRYTKDQYLDNLKKCFGSQEYINIRFANNDVIKLAKGGELYAIQIAQDYYSTTYGDKGYLFLIVDINDPEKPIIKVRTWQPDKDPNFGLYGPGAF
jgi:hypothetical protein